MADHTDPIEARIAAAMGDMDANDLELMPPPPAVWDGIVAALGDELPGNAGTGAARPVGPIPVPPVGAPPEPTRGRGRGFRVGLAVLAVAAVIAALFAVPAILRDGPEPRLEARADLTDEGLAATTTSTGRARLLDDAGKVVLDVEIDDLAPAADGQAYEVWLLNVDGEVLGLQSLGLTEGTGRFLVPDGVDPATYDVVDVSREPTDGDPTHSGDSILRGQLRPV